MKQQKNLIPRILLFLLAVACLGLLGTRISASGNAISSSPLQAEKGKFNILLDGKSVGQEQFDIAANGTGWIATGSSELTPPGGKKAKVTGKLTIQRDGSPVAYDWSAQTDKTNGAHIDFSNGVAKIILQMQGARPFEQDLTFGGPVIAVLDNNLYYQYAVLPLIYDWSKGGAQTFPVIIPQELTPGTITVEANGPVSADGVSYQGLKVATSDLEVQLYLDSARRLMRLEVPSAKVVVVRE
jgi:hypothetical protein